MEWYWWLLIILVVLVVLWLLLRLRQGSSSSRPGAVDRAPGAGGRAAGGRVDEAPESTSQPPLRDDLGRGAADVAGDESGLGAQARGFASTAGLTEPVTAAAPPGPYGEGSAPPNADGSTPAGYSIKGNIDSMLYHTPGSRWYEITVAEVWFRTVADAEAAGFSAPPAQGSPG